MSHLAADEERLGRRPAACPSCSATFLSGEGANATLCPACGEAELEPSEVHAFGSPERVVADTLGRDGVERALAESIAGVRYRCSGLRPEQLAARSHRSWWPVWLVDAEVVSVWSARAGTNYEVQSSREVLQKGKWVTQPHIDTRIRWEDRRGRVRLAVHNVMVHALRDHDRWEARVGEFDLPGVEGDLPDGVVRLPDRSPKEALADAAARFRAAAGVHCHRAMGCDHIDDFTFAGAPERSLYEPNWTWQLVPIYTTSYEDDAGTQRVLWVHGATGRVWGPRMASTRKGWMWAGLWLVLGGSCLAGSALVGLLGIVLWPLLLVAAVGGALGFGLLVLALVPILAPRRHNSSELQALGATVG